MTFKNDVQYFYNNLLEIHLYGIQNKLTTKIWQILGLLDFRGKEAISKNYHIVIIFLNEIFCLLFIIGLEQIIRQSSRLSPVMQ